MDAQGLLAATEALQDVGYELERFTLALLSAQPDSELSRESVATHLQIQMVTLFLAEWARALIDGASSEDALMAALAGKRQLTPEESAISEEGLAKTQRNHH